MRGAIVDPRGLPDVGAEVRQFGRLLARSTSTGEFEVTVGDEAVDLAFTHPRWLRATRTVAADEGFASVELSAGRS